MLRQKPPNPNLPREEKARKPHGDETQEQRRQRILAQRRCNEVIWRPKIPEVHEVDFEHFKNRYINNGSDYAIEALVGPPNIRSQIRDEETRRREADPMPDTFLSSYQLMEAWIDKGLGPNTRQKSRPIEAEITGSKNEKYIHRIRIQSQPILGYLTTLLDEPEQSIYRSWPRTFFRPFRPLVYFQSRMKEKLAELEATWKFQEAREDKHELYPDNEIDNRTQEDTMNPGSSANLEKLDYRAPYGDIETPNVIDLETKSESGKSLASQESKDENTSRMLAKVMDSTEALRDMRCYVDFVDRELMPRYNLLQGTGALKVAFDDLWYLFRVNDLVYSPNTRNTDRRHQEIWRVYRTLGPEPQTSYASRHSVWGLQDEFEADKYMEFTVYCYRIGHDGSSYGAVRHKFYIEAFPGERDILTLDVYPLRFARDREQILKAFEYQGKRFQSSFDDRHQSYNHWTVTPHTGTNDGIRDLKDEVELFGECMRNLMYGHRRYPEAHRRTYGAAGVGAEGISSEFIESHIIVDLEEAIKANPQWGPTFHRPEISKSRPSELEKDEWPIKIWSGKSRSKLVLSIPELIQLQDGIELRQRRENLVSGHDVFLRNHASRSRWEEMGPLSENLRPEDLVLLPKHTFAYTLRERKFVALDINHLKPVIREKGVFSRLKILKDYKDIIRGLVSSHFEKKDLERTLTGNSLEMLGQDLIRGKGKGLVILLHGAPGVGKTATAEAVATETNKPLFTITCGDLGLVASEVESSLTNIFRLAHKWDCVLLLDEADVFLSQRSRFDMKRNSLVSVFLRVLEYYNGLLFLTTNRVGTIDEAFKSRIHMSLYYPPLDKVQVGAIFKLNLERLRDIEKQRALQTGKPELFINDAEILSFADEHFDNTPPSLGRWNGRQIRNAFQTASSLAYYHYAEGVSRAKEEGVEPPPAPVLDARLFRKVQYATHSFDKYMRETKGWTDADLAHLLGERADHMSNTRPAPRDHQDNVPNATGNFMSSSFGQYPPSSTNNSGYGVHLANSQPFATSHSQRVPADGGQGYPQTPPRSGNNFTAEPFAHSNAQYQNRFGRVDTSWDNSPSQPPNIAMGGSGGISGSRPQPTDTTSMHVYGQNRMEASGQGYLGPISSPNTQSPGYGTSRSPDQQRFQQSSHHTGEWSGPRRQAEPMQDQAIYPQATESGLEGQGSGLPDDPQRRYENLTRVNEEDLY